MSYNDLSKLVIKAFKYFFIRPVKRFNVDNRAQKYLGPDAPKFKAAPRSMKYYVKKEGQDNIKDNTSLIGQVNKLVVNKITGHDPLATRHLESAQKSIDLVSENQPSSNRPLPVARNLPMQDPLDIWLVHKLPYGRLDVEKLTELMYNRLADEDYWSAKVVADKYKLNIDHAISLTKYVGIHKMLCSPKLFNYLELTGRENKLYQQIKGFAVEVDESLRSENDKCLDVLEETEKTNKDNLNIIRPAPAVEPLKVESLNTKQTPTNERRRLLSQIESAKRIEESKKMLENDAGASKQ